MPKRYERDRPKESGVGDGDGDGNREVFFKCVLLGPPGVGKTCLLNRLSTGRFLDCPLSTLASDSLLLSLPLPGGSVARMEMWDTGGQERYRSLTQSYYRDAKALLLVYDAQRKVRISEWLMEARRYLARQEALLFLLGAKLDLGDDVRLTEEEVTSLCQVARGGGGFGGGDGGEEVEVEACYVLSAKTGQHVQSTFNSIALAVSRAGQESRLDLRPRQGTVRAGKGGNHTGGDKYKCCSS